MRHRLKLVYYSPCNQLVYMFCIYLLWKWNSLLDSFTYNSWLLFTNHHHMHSSVHSYIFSSHCLTASSNCACSPSSGLLECHCTSATATAHTTDPQQFTIYNISTEVKVKVTLWLTVSQSVCLGVGHPFGAHDQILLFLSFAGKLLYSSLSVNCSAICQWSESQRTHNHTLLSHLRLLGSLSVASYDSQELWWKY
jgi:hypothetical protein